MTNRHKACELSGLNSPDVHDCGVISGRLFPYLQPKVRIAFTIAWFYYRVMLFLKVEWNNPGIMRQRIFFVRAYDTDGSRKMSCNFKGVFSNFIFITCHERHRHSGNCRRAIRSDSSPKALIIV
jgi:hypothetical protein